MKLTTFLLCITVLQVFARSTYSQNTKLTLNLGETTVEQVLREIENKSEFYFLFNQKLVNINRKINLQVTEKKIDEILAQVFYGTNVDYVVIDRQIVLSPGEYLAQAKAKLQPRTITGTVTDENGESLPGVSISIKGTTRGTITNMDGEYTIEVDDPSAILIFSFVGYITQEKIGDQTQINVAMQLDLLGLDEVVIVGYGTARKINLTGSVAQVEGEKIENRALPDLMSILQGITPNLNILPSVYGQEPGTPMEMSIRGVGTLTGDGGVPYVLVDGSPMDINHLNPRDIKSISILKDAAASAIYGSRAPFGVIIITTKQGKRNSPPTFDYSGNFLMVHPTVIPRMMNSLEMATLANYSCRNSGVGDRYPQEQIDRIKAYIDGTLKDEIFEDPLNPGYYASHILGNGNNDWPTIYYDHWTPRHQHNVNFSGGTDLTNYYVGVGFYDEDGIINYGDEFHKKYNVNANFTTDIADWFSMNFNAKYMHQKIRRDKILAGGEVFDRTGMWHMTTFQDPSYPLYAPDGRIFDTTVRSLKDLGETMLENHDLWIKIGGVLEPIEGWETHLNFSYNNFSNRDYDYTLQLLKPRPNGLWEIDNYSTRFDEEFGNNNYYIFNIYSSYEKSLGNHNFSTMVGYEQEYNESRGLVGWQRDLLSNLVPSIRTAVGEWSVDDYWEHWSTQGIFARVTYNFNEKYLFETNVRYDGSSRFEKAEAKWGFFPSASIGYNISREPFWNSVEDLTSLNLLKLRASYGTLGNQNVPNYLYLPIIQVSTNSYWIEGNQQPNFANAPILISSDLTWETSETFNIGFDAGLFDSRLGINFDLFRRRTINMFGPALTLPAVLGTTAPMENNAELLTKGFELVVSWRDYITSDLNYRIEVLLGDNQATVTKYNNPDYYLSDWYEGKKVGEIWGYETLGLFQSDEEVANHADQSLFHDRWQAGDVKYKDLNNDGKINYGDMTLENHGDMKIIGNETPRYLFSFTGAVNYRRFDFSMFWLGVGKIDAWFGTRGDANAFWGVGSGPASCFWKIHRDYWTPEGSDHGGGPDAFLPRPYNLLDNEKNRQVQTRYLQNCAYIRLKNIQLGYTIPENITEKIKIKRARIFVSGENILTFSKMKYSDFIDAEMVRAPSRGIAKNYPMLKLYSLGANITF